MLRVHQFRRAIQDGHHRDLALAVRVHRAVVVIIGSLSSCEHKGLCFDLSLPFGQLVTSGVHP